jgi:competence protein ComEC
LGCILVLWPPRAGEFRCTFLAVGHGGCTVLEMPNGQVIMYDAGAIGGPDVTRRHIAPFLWNRGYRRIDEIFISHGDLDHFNGLPALLERFSIGRVTLTPSYADRSTRGVAFTLRALERYGLKTRVLHAPARWETAGVEFEVLHPPEKGPDGNENSRSLVLAIRRQELTILLTGDLEGAGLERVLKLPAPRVDVLMAPHHGSRTANTKELAAWARPKLVVSCQGLPKSVPKEANPYEAIGARWASTWSQGAVTIQRDGGAWVAETWLTRNRWMISR